MGGIIGKDVAFVLTSKDPIDEDQNCGKGPLGKGDPHDFLLREREILVNIPALQLQAAIKQKCKDLKEAQAECADNSVIALYSCSEESEKFMSCVDYWVRSKEYNEQLTQEYLNIREEYRKTGRRRLYRALKGETYVAPDQLKGFQV